MWRSVCLMLLFSNLVLSQDKTYKEATIFFKNNEFEKAKEIMQKAIKFKEKNNPNDLFLYAKILKSLNQTDSCFYYFNLLEKEYQSRHIQDSLLLVVASKLELYRYLNYKNETDFYIEKLDQIGINSIYNKDIVAYALNRKIAALSLYHFGNQDTIQMVKMIGKQILDLEPQITNKEIVAYTLNELALNEDYRGDKNKALKKYEDALAYVKIHQLTNPEIDVSFIYAQHYARYKRNNPKAIEILKAIENKVLNGTNLFHKQRLYGELRNYYYEVGSYKKAFETSDLFFEYYKQFDFSKSREKLTEIEKKYDLAEKQKVIQNKEAEIIIQNLELNNSKKRFWLISSIFGFSILVSIALFFIFRREKRRNKELRLLSKENDFLMSEANHRINNNLQLIIILIERQIEKLNKKESAEIKKILVKINSIATLHKHLYQSKNKRAIDIQKYLCDIENSFKTLFDENEITSVFSSQQMLLIIDDAMYLGLILTELYINSIKHAFEPHQTKKQIIFNIFFKDEGFVFSFKDNGQNFKNQKKLHFKPVLVDQLCRQLEVNYEISYSAGFEFVFSKTISTKFQNIKHA